jgi:riboflavin kinase/FMN adenylyltransferase
LALLLSSVDNTNISGAWVTIGSFDGVHRGHQELIRGLVKEAHQAGAPAVVLTFYPHPAVVLRGISGPFYLTPPAERRELIIRLGVDEVVTLAFNQQLASLSAAEFMSELSTRLALNQLWVGFNFALGHNREGNVPVLQRLGEALDYSVKVIPPININGSLISSSLIRKALAAGGVEDAALGLGRFYSVTGEVVRGNGRGHQLGFPTANLFVWNEQLIPAYGIYACWVWVDGERRPAVTSIGVRPTFEKNPVIPTIETYLLDFNRNLYGQQLRLEFVTRLRDELRFNSIGALVDQINLDVENAKRLLI